MTVMMGLRARLEKASLFVLLRADEDEAALRAAARGAVDGGADVVVLLPGELSGETLAARLRALSREIRTEALLGLADSPEAPADAPVDLLVAAPGQRVTKPHPWALVGRTATSAEQVTALLARSDVDLLVVGPSVGRDARGTALVRDTARAVEASGTTKPWFAVGGVTLDTVDEVLAAGARRLGIGGRLVDASEVRDMTRGIDTRLRRLSPAPERRPSGRIPGLPGLSGPID